MTKALKMEVEVRDRINDKVGENEEESTLIINDEVPQSHFKKNSGYLKKILK